MIDLGPWVLTRRATLSEGIGGTGQPGQVREGNISRSKMWKNRICNSVRRRCSICSVTCYVSPSLSPVKCSTSFAYDFHIFVKIGHAYSALQLVRGKLAKTDWRKEPVICRRLLVRYMSISSGITEYIERAGMQAC